MNAEPRPPILPGEAAPAFGDGFEVTEVDQKIAAVHGMQGAGHFLIDRQGIVRWTHIEAGESIANLVEFPADAKITEAVRSLAR